MGRFSFESVSHRSKAKHKILFNLRPHSNPNFSQGQFHSLDYLRMFQLLWLFKTFLLLLVLLRTDTECYSKSHREYKTFKAPSGFINPFLIFLIFLIFLKQYLCSENEDFIKIITERIRMLDLIVACFALCICKLHHYHRLQ